MHICGNSWVHVCGFWVHVCGNAWVHVCGNSWVHVCGFWVHVYGAVGCKVCNCWVPLYGNFWVHVCGFWVQVYGNGWVHSMRLLGASNLSSRRKITSSRRKNVFRAKKCLLGYKTSVARPGVHYKICFWDFGRLHRNAYL